MTLQYVIEDLKTHQRALTNQHTALSDTSASMSATGAGPTEMYGILVGQVAHPLLQLTVDNGTQMLAALSSLLDSFASTMSATVTAYESTEQDNVDRTSEIVAGLSNI